MVKQTAAGGAAADSVEHAVTEARETRGLKFGGGSECEAGVDAAAPETAAPDSATPFPAPSGGFSPADPAPRCSAPSAGPPVHRSGLDCPHGRSSSSRRPERQPYGRCDRGCAACTAARQPRRGGAAPRSASAPMTRQELHPRTHCTNWRIT